MKMNMRDYLTLQLDTNYGKGMTLILLLVSQNIALFEQIVIIPPRTDGILGIIYLYKDSMINAWDSL